MALEGRQFGHYQLVRLIGSGGMGEVYLAEDTRITRNVAIKVVRNEPDPYSNVAMTQEAVRLFEREMKAITALDHPNILPLLDFGEETVNNVTYIYLVMPFRSEGSLVDWLHQQNNADPLSEQEAIHFVRQAAAALQHAHNHHLMHLDVKPSNFLIRQQDDHSHLPDILLADFGISRFETSTATTSQSIRGTPTYMAPEQWAGTPVLATDQYALAIMAYQFLTGKSPFQGNMQQVMYQHIHTPPQPPSVFNSHIPPAVDALIMRALAKKPEERFPSIQVFADTFAHAWNNKTVPARSQLSPTQEGTVGSPSLPTHIASHPSTPPGSLPAKIFGVPLFALILGVIVVIVIGSFTFTLFNHPSSSNNGAPPNISSGSSITSIPTATATSIPTTTLTPTPSSIPQTPTPVPPAPCNDQNGAPPNGVESTIQTINCTLPAGQAALIVVCNHAQLLQPFYQDLEGPGIISYQNPTGSSSIAIKAENSALANASCPSKFLVLPLTQVDGQVTIEVQRLKNLIGNNAGVTYFKVVGENSTRNYY